MGCLWVFYLLYDPLLWKLGQKLRAGEIARCYADDLALALRSISRLRTFTPILDDFEDLAGVGQGPKKCHWAHTTSV